MLLPKKLLIPIYTRSNASHGFAALDNGGFPAPDHFEITIDTDRLSERAMRFIDAQLYRTGVDNARYLLIGWDVLNACVDTISGDLKPEDLFLRLGQFRVLDYETILVGSMQGMALLPRLEPEPKKPIITERGELIAAHMNAVAKQVLRQALSGDYSSTYRDGMLETLRVFCDGLGIENPYLRNELEKEVLKSFEVAVL